MMRVLVTGAGGFLSRHLTAYLAARGDCSVWGVRRVGGQDETVHGLERCLRCDLKDERAVAELLAEARPDRVYHMAAQSSVAESWKEPWRTLDENVRPAVNLLEALHAASRPVPVLVAGSAEEYGMSAAGSERVAEETPLKPSNPYGVSKLVQGLLAGHYGREGMKVVRTRGFNAIGPGQDARFVTADFARQTARIEAGLQPPVIRAGNLDAVRDFIDVRDAVRACWMALEGGVSGEVYNVCGGRGRAVREVLDFYGRVSRRPFEVVTDPDKLRPNDPPQFVGDPSKLERTTGWRPEIPFESTLADVLEYWRRKVREEEVS